MGLKSKLLTAVLVGGLASYMGCADNSPVMPSDNDTELVSLEKNNKNKNKNKNGNGNKKGNTPPPPVHFPIIKSKSYVYHQPSGGYLGGSIKFGPYEKCKFGVDPLSITPPPGHKNKKPVKITMEVDYDESAKELVFTFGPSGTKFRPSAEIKLDYSMLNVDVPVLYYIDKKGNYIEQAPDHIDVGNKWLKIRVDHFSRYAVAHSR